MRLTDDNSPTSDLPLVVPPDHLFALAGHHWLESLDADGQHHGTVVLFWQPGAKRWCHSGLHSTFNNTVDVRYHRYLAPCPMPPLPKDMEKLERLLDRPIYSAEDVSFFRRLLRGWVA